MSISEVEVGREAYPSNLAANEPGVKRRRITLAGKVIAPEVTRKSQRFFDPRADGSRCGNKCDCRRLFVYRDGV